MKHNILIIDYGNIMNDCIKAFHKLGNHTLYLKYKNIGDNKIIVDLDFFKKVIKEFKPSFIFSINMRGVNIDLFEDFKIPTIIWFMDDPLIYIEYLRPSPYLLLFIMDRAFIDELKKRKFEKVFYLPFGINEDDFRFVKLNKKEMLKYRCDLSFIGSSIRDNGYRTQIFSKITNNIARRIFEEAINWQSQNSLLNMDKLLKTFQHKYNFFFPFDEQYMKKVSYILEKEAMCRRRESIIGYLSELDYNLKIFGDEYWKEILKDPSIYGGNLKRREELVKAYNGSKISINIHRAQARTTINFRVFEATACGSFLLTDFREDLYRLFKEDEIIHYLDIDHLRDLISYYLKHEEERKRIAQRAYQRTHKYHTYTKRLIKLINIFESIYQ
jgi:spore maturation protein CgeB